MRTNWMWMDVMRNSESETTRLRDYETEGMCLEGLGTYGTRKGNKSLC